MIKVLGEAARIARRISAPNCEFWGMVMASESKGIGVTPCILNPQPASHTTVRLSSARTIDRVMKFSLLTDNVDKLARHYDHALGGTALQITGNGLMGNGELFDLFSCGFARNTQATTQLTVDL